MVVRWSGRTVSTSRNGRSSPRSWTTRASAARLSRAIRPDWRCSRAAATWPYFGTFEPRASEGIGEPVVWAIDAARLRNYLVPRDCPRVTYYAGRDTSDADVDRFLGSSAAVLAIEREWLERVRACRLHCYHMPPGTFE